MTVHDQGIKFVGWVSNNLHLHVVLVVLGVLVSIHSLVNHGIGG